MNDPEHDPAVEVDPLDVEDPPAEPAVLPFDEWADRVEKAFQFEGLSIPPRTPAWRQAYDDDLNPLDFVAVLKSD